MSLVIELRNTTLRFILVSPEYFRVLASLDSEIVCESAETRPLFGRERNTLDAPAPCALLFRVARHSYLRKTPGGRLRTEPRHHLLERGLEKPRFDKSRNLNRHQEMPEPASPRIERIHSDYIGPARHRTQNAAQSLDHQAES